VVIPGVMGNLIGDLANRRSRRVSVESVILCEQREGSEFSSSSASAFLTWWIRCIDDQGR